MRGELPDNAGCALPTPAADAASQPPPASEGEGVSELRRCLGSYAATMAVIAIGLYFYTALSPYYIALYRLSWTPMLGAYVAPLTIDLPLALKTFAGIYALVLLPYYALRPGRFSNAYTMFRFLCKRIRSSPAGANRHVAEADRQAMLCLLLKFIFIPFCIHGIVAYLAYTNDQIVSLGVAMAGKSGAELSSLFFSLYNSHLHYFILNLIFLVDFFPFVVGYLVQARLLDNEVVSVDASLGGWMACLVCYPPFNAAMAALLPWQVVDLAPAYPAFPATVHLALNALLLTCFAFYAYASVSLGFKCSNLMHRGIVRRGLYRRIRHPAYLFKNLAWWTGAMPLLVYLAQTSLKDFFWTCFCIAGWSGIYVLRALAEERHLSRHADYRVYMKQVPFRIIPGIA
jgi:protein-S-isoprenylcysteine O-methyltransferase Ste14